MNRVLDCWVLSNPAMSHRPYCSIISIEMSQTNINL